MRASNWLAIAALLLLLGGGGVIVYNQTRGLRNNNPGNIRRSPDQWQGLAPEQTDAEFFQFVKPEYGIRALTIIVQNYRSQYGRNTVRKIIERYAPSNENDTEAYIADVATYAGVDPDQQLTDNNVPAVVTGIIRHENGIQPYDAVVLAQGFALAGVAYA